MASEKNINTTKVRIIAVAATVLIVVLLVCLVVNLVRIGQVNKRRHALQAEAAAQQQRIEQLQDSIAQYEDLDAIEKNAREQLGMIGDDETLYEAS